MTRLSNFFLGALLAISAANLWVSYQTPHTILESIRRANVAKQTMKGKVSVTIHGQPEQIPIEVETTQGENVPENPHGALETRSQWNLRTNQTLKALHDDTVAFYAAGQ